MNQRSFTAFIVLLAILASLAYIWQPWSNETPLKLGLDLQGGLRVVLQAQEEEVEQDHLIAARSVIENRVNEFGVAEPVVQTSGDRRIVVELPGLATSLVTISYNIDKDIDIAAVQAAIDNLDFIGVSGIDATIEEIGQSDESKNISVQVNVGAGESDYFAELLAEELEAELLEVETSFDQQRALDLIGQRAVLEFRLVKQTSAGKLATSMTAEDLEDIAFTGEILSSARAGFDQAGTAAAGGISVYFEIKQKFSGEFASFTGGNLGRRMAIVLDGSVMSAPILNGAISTRGQITGMANLEEASDLALVLRSGSLPISLEVQEIRAIGPTLGKDSIAAGKRAALIGGGAVIVAILLYYGPLFGFVLTIGLTLVMLFVFGALAGLNAVLTLPGLAGLVLTIGAAVDGNVISFERIKEELRSGKGLRLSMKNGFQNSLSAIIDANVTTLLAAAALYQYTSGPVRGFAVTLAIGIVSAVFVNTVVVPFILEVLTLRIKRSFMFNFKGFEGLKFVSKAPLVLGFSGLLALASIYFILTQGVNPSTDFTGGSNVLYQVNEDTDVNTVRNAIDELKVEGISGRGAIIQEVFDNTVQGNLISVRIPLVDGENSSQFPNDLANAIEANLLQADFVGPAVGEELRNAAFIAVLVSISLILIYVGWRFWPNWIIAIAAIVAVIHDVGIVLGANNILGGEFSIPVLAAILFVVGYSLNDSIIISDRIRENFKKIRGFRYQELVDISVNQTLSRTLVTSGTTLLPVLALFFLGGSVLHDFSTTLLIGIAVGTYSSIFILSPMVVWVKQRQRAVKPASRKSRAAR